jgi:uncharacterized protein (DUF1501 family)
VSAGVATLIVGGIVAGRVHAAWPGLHRAGLLDGDLPASNDYRLVLAGLLEKGCGVAGSTVFPGPGSARTGDAAR